MERRAGAGSWRAHPRSRGENISDRRGEHSRPGSSPLARGKLEGRLAALSGQRLIPARAGKTLAIGTKTPTHPAHPRSRGENNLSEDDSSFWRGSSPLARGKLRRLPSSSLRSGLIPARAGKTPRIAPIARARRAHPRSRGENDPSPDLITQGSGSSPLARGKPIRQGHGWIIPRLIPARAGKTVGVRGGGFVAWAHPRSRGENGRTSLPSSPVNGSSPLARGKLRRRRSNGARARLIPARAGKIVGAFGDATRILGSSPLARGKRGSRTRRLRRQRLIPARAGKTIPPALSRR